MTLVKSPFSVLKTLVIHNIDAHSLKESWSKPVRPLLVTGENIILEMGCDAKAARNSAVFVAGGLALLFFWLLFIPVIVAPFVVMHAIAKAKNSGIVITDRSVFMVDSGTVKSIRLKDVASVRDSGAGALTVTDRGGGKLTWEHLRNPSRAARQLRQSD